jgi:hypothetical protein
MKLTVELSENEAWALAEMCRRFDRDHARRLADAFDDDAEMEAMLDAIMASGHDVFEYIANLGMETA